MKGPQRSSSAAAAQVVTKPGPTGRCTILSCNGQRTMRTCLTGCARLQPEELQLGDFTSGGAKFIFLNACEAPGRGPAWHGMARRICIRPYMPPTSPLARATEHQDWQWGCMIFSKRARAALLLCCDADCLYNPGLLERAVELARQAGVAVAFDLASFEVVRDNLSTLRALLESDAVACCFSNEVRHEGTQYAGCCAVV